MPDDDNVGRNNAKVGDVAWHRPDVSAAWELNRKVNRVGIVNKHGYPLDVELTYDDGSDPIIVSPMYSELTLIVPPASECPDMFKLIEQYKNLLPVRDACNSDVLRYHVLCVDCREKLQFVLTQTEVATVRFVDGDEFLSTDKPEVDDTESEMSCCCPGLLYTIPMSTYDGFDYYNEET